jgi:hypothetical protein
MNDVPIVPAFTKTFQQASVPCIFCGHIHRHGTAPGARLSHCIGIETKQYELRFIVGALPEVYRLLERQIRKIERRFFSMRMRPERYLSEQQQLLLCICALNAGILGKGHESVYGFSQVVRGLYSPKKRREPC